MNTRGLDTFIREFNPVRVLINLHKHRQLIKQMTLREISQRYRGSYLGILWSFIVPLLMMAVYTFVFSVIFRARWGMSNSENSTAEFALTLFAGLTAFNVFAEVINRAPSLILSTPNYVKKVVFPLQILPVVATGSAIINSLISCLLVVVGSIFMLKTFSITILLLPLAYLPLILLALGLAWILASLGVYIRDIGQLTPVVVQVLFFLSPVFYPPTSVPPKFQLFLKMNPLTIILDTFRRSLLWGQMPDWKLWGIWTFVSLLVCLAGHAWFMRTKKGFADVV